VGKIIKSGNSYKTENRKPLGKAFPGSSLQGSRREKNGEMIQIAGEIARKKGPMVNRGAIENQAVIRLSEEILRPSMTDLGKNRSFLVNAGIKKESDD